MIYIAKYGPANRVRLLPQVDPDTIPISETFEDSIETYEVIVKWNVQVRLVVNSIVVKKDWETIKTFSTKKDAEGYSQQLEKIMSENKGAEDWV